ncbi:MAG TPA: hypothetical protein DCS13_08105 [Candidatus Margulisbacteria bacterium]|nr:MAG: hypothetical protein A2X43_14035 [Candidatus Margulisbacteria bacterium GWD2_39_127]HAR63410.1 hypothetical protein [Candidatus Margulisiibacteriota bacterium]
MWKEDFIKLLFPANVDEINLDKALEIKYKNIPSSLYKYKKFDAEGHSIEIIEQDKIFLSTANNLNDPYDSAVSLNPQSNYFEAKWDDLMNNLKSRNRFAIEDIAALNALKYDDQFIYMTALYLLNKNPKVAKGKPAEIIAKEISDIMLKRFEAIVIRLSEAIRKNTYITCFSEDNSSILMWSHYGDNHKGFCIEYDFSKLSPSEVSSRMLFPVIYRQKLFDATRYSSKIRGGEFNNYFGVLAAMTKAIEWSYEKEWRFILPMGEVNELLYLFPPSPAKIYLGANTSEENTKIVLDIAQRKNIEVHKMLMKTYEFSLTSKRIF